MHANRSLRANHWLQSASPCAFLLCLLACAGCGKEKTTGEMVNDLKSGQGRDKISAARSLAEREEDPAKVIPPLIEALKDKSQNVRRSSAISLGSYGEKAKDAIPALKVLQKDGDARVREAAGVALSRIDPSRFSGSAKARPGPGK
jgi:HEAT repeat protein